ncbi:MAG: hypothetical protein CL868_04120 [Cytophagaceae bacterium]|nr:hypothetical protein [Cytophagaceae bacterium]|tara:strand:+ start:1358 stop:2419 length:1062 start_codon:yes stop_codon:yes gene_type:complete
MVKGLRYNGQNVMTANATVIPPQDGSTMPQINVNDKLASGTRIIVPPHTMISLQSPAGNQLISSTSGKSMEYTVKMTDKGENHTVRGLGAQIKSTVTKSVSYNYRVNNGRGTTSAARGTEFTFTDMSQANHEEAIITTEEGAINIIDKMPVNIAGHTNTNERGEPLTKAVSQMQYANSGTYTSSDAYIEYDNLEDAVAQIVGEVYSIEDPEERADNLLFLGDLYMELEEYEKAIKPYQDAMEILEAYYGFEDLYTVDAVISFAQAIGHAGIEKEADDLLNSVLEYLKALEESDIEDLQYISELEYLEDEDHEAYDIICGELMDVFGLLGWVYDIYGDTVTSDQYYKNMQQGCY